MLHWRDTLQDKASSFVESNVRLLAQQSDRVNHWMVGAYSLDVFGEHGRGQTLLLEIRTDENRVDAQKASVWIVLEHRFMGEAIS